MRHVARLLTLAAILASLSSVASGYYHWVYFVNRDGPFTPIRAKFDLAALPSKTVSFFVSDQLPSVLVPNDNYDALLSQIRRAADTWNGVSTSDLRLRFGGISTVGVPQTGAGIDVVFDDDMPPGLFAQTTVSTTDLASLATADPAPTSLPIVRSRLQLRSDLTTYKQASYSDEFFMTIVHEFGHTLGLQHSQTSATMSTSLTRSTTKALPLSTDDRAAISVLYPAPSFARSTGSITGQVKVAGEGASLASVVALATNGTVVGAMTNPDGTYRIDGVPPGDYYVYAHPLPPPQQGETLPAQVMPPLDPAGEPFLADTRFDTQFFPGTHVWQDASLMTVRAAAALPDVNFDLQRRSGGAAIYDMRMFGYMGAQQVPVHAPALVPGDRRWLVFNAPGLLTAGNRSLTRGLGLSVIGDVAQLEQPSLGYFTSGFLLMVVDTNAVSSATPIAVAVTTANDLYVLPAAFSVVPSLPPGIFTVSGDTNAQGDATVTIAGENLGTDMRFLFDGFAAKDVKVNENATVTMTAPTATGNHAAAVEILSSFGQTSSQALGEEPPLLFTYAAPDNLSLAVESPNFKAGTDTMVEIRGFNTKFSEGETVVGFGSSDITVRKTWVMDPGLILLNISVGPAATPGPAIVTVATALQVVSLNNVVQILPADVPSMSLRVPVVNRETGLAGVAAGGVAVLGTTGLPADLTGWILTIADINTGFSLDADNRIHVFIPLGLPLGPAVLRLIPPAGSPIPPVPPVLVQIDAPPPVIVAATGPDGSTLDDTHFATAGDVITLLVSGLGNDPLAVVPAASVRVLVGGIQHMPTSVDPPNEDGVSQIQFVFPGGLPDASQQPLAVRVRTRMSLPYQVTLAPAPPVPPVEPVEPPVEPVDPGPGPD